MDPSLASGLLHGAETSQPSHPGSWDSGILEAGLLVAGPGPHPELPRTDLICLGLPEYQHFLGWGHFCCFLSLSLTAFNSSPPLATWIGSGYYILGLWVLVESYMSLILPLGVAVVSSSPPAHTNLQYELLSLG